MKLTAKEFDLLGTGTVFDPAAGRARLQAEAAGVAAMLGRAVPPEAMRAAPVAPARGAMFLEPNFVVQAGGTRRIEGGHWVTPSPLDVQAVQETQRRRATNPEARAAQLFTPGQVSAANEYRTLSEWRAGSGVKCSSLEAGRGGSGGSGEFIVTFVTHGERLDWLVAQIGKGYALQPRRNMDRDNARRAIPLRALVDLVLLRDLTLSRVLTRHGWPRKTLSIAALRGALCGALDRMQGY